MAAQNQAGTTITICMGSSCYSRGNSRNLEAIREIISSRKLDASVKLVGHLCEDRCRVGPNIAINGQTHSEVDAGTAVAIVMEQLRSD